MKSEVDVQTWGKGMKMRGLLELFLFSSGFDLPFRDDGSPEALVIMLIPRTTTIAYTISPGLSRRNTSFRMPQNSYPPIVLALVQK